MFIFIFDTHAENLHIGKCYKTNEESPIESPTEFAIDDAGNIYIANSNYQKIQVYSCKGDFLYSIQLESPSAYTINLNNTNILIGEIRSNKIWSFDNNGILLSVTQTNRDSSFLQMSPYEYFANGVQYHMNLHKNSLDIIRLIDGNSYLYVTLPLKQMEYIYYVFPFVGILVVIIIIIRVIINILKK